MQAGIKGLGFVAPMAGTPLRATNNLSNPAAEFKCRAFFIQAVAGNSDIGFVEEAAPGAASVPDMRTTGKSGTSTVVGFVAAPSVNASSKATSLPSFSPNESVRDFPGFDLSNIWIDCNNTGDKFLVSYLP